MNDQNRLPDEESEELKEMAESLVRTLANLAIEETEFSGMDKIAKRYFYAYLLQELKDVLNADLLETQE